MTDYTVVNGTNLTYSNVNVGGVDVGAFSYRDGVTLDATELAALVNGSSFPNASVFADLTGDAAAAQKKRASAVGAQKLNPLA